MLCSTAQLHSTMPTGNIPEVPELGTLRYKGQIVGPSGAHSSRGTTQKVSNRPKINYY